MNELAELITHQARELGFDKVAMLPAVVLHEEYERLQHWLAQGHHGSMAWMADHGPLRREPGLIVEGTRTIVCVAINYYPDDPVEASASETPAVKVARYARGKDYHKTIRRKLRQLLTIIQAHYPHVQGRAFCDSAPLLEKALAVRAGFGWLGKNGLLISRDLGSWLFLGELMLDCAVEPLLIQPSETLTLMDTGHCGRCRRCIDACPTEAIVSPTVVDARRCIAYWTIENDAPTLPDWLISNLEGWAFGCDICQEVCPWNLRFAQPTREPDFKPRDWLNPLESDKFLAMDAAAFDTQVVNSPLRRTGLKRLRRNIQAVLASR